jgi:tRNA-splicing ligase RtcB (3'-phosphate/5'-hydroxy nucleic acid ligase)
MSSIVTAAFAYADEGTVPFATRPGAIPIVSWANPIDRRTFVQATNLSNLPFAIDHVALMPDAHAGYGMPIGGVLFAARAVVPYAIGVDIGCGVALVETDLTVEDLPQADLEALLADIDRGVPTGFYGLKTPVDRELAQEAMGIVKPASVKDVWFEKALSQLGTLGGGNHFLELQRDAAGAIYVMLHSGSRSLGKAICDEYHKRALALNKAWHSKLPDDELAFLPVGSDDHAAYWSAMEFALRFAEVNRSRMLDVVEKAFERHTTVGRMDRLIDVHHNYAAWENHLGTNGIVHRKGAVRARNGEVVLIPGSMGTASYVGEGLGNAEAFETCQHGAGRALSRGAARKAKTSADVYAEMATLGVVLRSSEPRGVAEEAAFAYKDIESVMAASASLVKPTKRLTPLGVVKG